MTDNVIPFPVEYRKPKEIQLTKEEWDFLACKLHELIECIQESTDLLAKDESIKVLSEMEIVCENGEYQSAYEVLNKASQRMWAVTGLIDEAMQKEETL